MFVDRRPPGPRGHWLLGSLPAFMSLRLDFLTQTARDFGDIAAFRFGHRRIFLINHPDLIEQVLVTDSKHYIKHFGARMYKPILGNGLVTSEGDFWLRQRKLSQPAFLKQRVHGYGNLMVQATEQMLAEWAPGQVRDVHGSFSQLTSTIALKTLFGLEMAEDRDRFVEALRAVFDLIGQRFARLIQWPDWLPTKHNRELKARIRELTTVVAGFIAQGKARRDPSNDLLSRLLAAQDDDGTRMSQQQLLDETMTLYLAGHETTALTLAYSWYLLAQHPAEDDLLATEWKVVLNGRVPTVEDLPKLVYTEHVITEAMRLLPPVYLIGREATKPLTLGGYDVPRGTTIFMSQWVTHRDARFYDDPLAFKPARWANGLAKTLPKYAYYPFGGGPRVCIGNTFAMMEAVLILATVGQRYRFTLNPDPPVTFWPTITLIPENGIPATLQRR
jgi:cytochrome P450